VPDYKRKSEYCGLAHPAENHQVACLWPAGGRRDQLDWSGFLNTSSTGDIGYNREAVFLFFGQPIP
jgi:hypothetical protein